MLLQPKNWAVFQHYKDRCPPWIKLHRDLLNNREFICLPIASKALAPMLWLLASEAKNGVFDASVEELTFRLRITEKEYGDGIRPLIDKGFFIISSGVLAERYQGAIPETEGETKKEKEKETKNTVAPPFGVTDSVWQDFKTLRKVKKAPITNAALDGIQREAAKAGWSMESALKECCTRGWVGFKAEWVAKIAPDKPQYDPDSRAAIEAEGIEKGVGPWDEGMEQWHVYKAKVRGKPEAPPNLAQLLALAKRKAA